MSGCGNPLPSTIDLLGRLGVTMELPLALVQQLNAGKCVLFLGAGVGHAMTREDGSRMPGASELAIIIDEAFSLGTGSSDLARVSQIAMLRRGRTDMVAAVQEALSNFEPSRALISLTQIRWQAIFTTNYDPGIVHAYQQNPTPPQKPVVVSSASDAPNVDRRFDIPIYFLHGNLFGTKPSEILITADDYSSFRRSRRMLFDVLRSSFADSTFLYVGYGNQDPNWAMLQADIQAEFGTAPLPRSFRIAPATPAIDREILEAKNIQTIDGTLDDLSLALKAITEETVPSSLALELNVPAVLQDQFSQNAAAVLRLLNSWEVCNDADFVQESNISAFLRGDRPNWGTIDRKLTFQRDIEDEIYDNLLDFITQRSRVRITRLILGSAGYGVSTLLMQIAHRLVRDRATIVLRLRPGANILEADVVFAARAFRDVRSIFVVDDAAWKKPQLRSAMQALSHERASAGFLLGARLNEWRSTHGAVAALEYPLEPLSDSEITGLLRLLDDTGELGELRNLDSELRFAQIKSRNRKELLVTLREVTEGKQFDAIVEDEYRKIDSPLALKLYELTCALSQEGEYLRDTVAARIMNADLSDLFEVIKTQLDGVVFHDELDAANGIFAFRARHRIIAQIVWHRCLSGAAREAALLETIRSLNLVYRSDRAAFDALIQSDELVDSMPSVDSRIHYFESAALSDPRNSYVLQHFARMFLRADQPLSALGQIERALKQSPDIRVLRHTHGVILARLSGLSPGEELGRKYLAQAEAEFRYCIRSEKRDQYGYQSLAELYREWAERASSDEDAASYYRKAEEVIAEGLRATRTHDRLHIESAKVAHSLGRRPDQLAALKRAVDSNTASIYARYLLGRALRENRRFEEAAEVLRPVLISDPLAFRAAIELSLSIVTLNQNYLEGAAILRGASLFGEKDARYIAVLGGMQFLGRRLDAAKATFDRGRQLPAEEQREIHYRPKCAVDGASSLAPVQLTGHVVKVGAGYAFLSVPGYLEVFCPTDRIANRSLLFGERVRFSVIFNAKGPLADPSSLHTV